MEKFFFIQGMPVGTKFNTAPYFTDRVKADDYAKRQAAANMKAGGTADFVIFEAVAVAKAPVPNVDIVEIK